MKALKESDEETKVTEREESPAVKPDSEINGKGLVIYVPMPSFYELSGHVTAEGRGFFNDALFPGQRRDNASLSIAPDFYCEWENGSSFTFVPFARLDSADSERSHFDVRELNYLWLADSWELRVGIGKVFWGVTEFVHLVDIVNQTDLVESIDGEDKLGQSMVHLSIPRDWGIVDMFVLPFFRERTFPGQKGRLRSAVTVDTDKARFESGSEENHVDFALRYSHTYGDWDVGVYHFKGTGREPTFLLDPLNQVIIPYYEQIDQTGVDLQLVEGEWLFKLEAVYRTGQMDSRSQEDDFFACTGGFEYTFVRVGETYMDLGVIGEFAYDDRGDGATTPYENDVMLGLRLSVNDAASSELLAGVSEDTEISSRVVTIEASRRFGNNWKGTLEATAFFEVPEDDILLYNLRDDDFVRIEMAYYF